MESRDLLLAQLEAQHGLVRALLAECAGGTAAARAEDTAAERAGITAAGNAEPEDAATAAGSAHGEVARLLDHLASCGRELLRLAGRGPDDALDPWDAVEGLLRGLTEDDLDRGPVAPLEPGVPAAGTTLRTLLAGHVGHLAWHLGQAARIRRQAGLAPMPGWPLDSQRPLDA